MSYYNIPILPCLTPQVGYADRFYVYILKHISLTCICCYFISLTSVHTFWGNIAENNIVGTLPQELRNLHYIKQFHLEQNVGLTGPIPSEYGEFAHMDYLAIISTSLNGKIPSTFGDLKKLQVLSLEVRALLLGIVSPTPSAASYCIILSLVWKIFILTYFPPLPPP